MTVKKIRDYLREMINDCENSIREIRTTSCLAPNHDPKIIEAAIRCELDTYQSILDFTNGDNEDE